MKPIRGGLICVSMAALLLAGSAHAAPRVKLVKDINPGPSDHDGLPHYLTRFQGDLALRRRGPGKGR